MVLPGRPRRVAAQRAGDRLRTIARQEEQTRADLNITSDGDTVSDSGTVSEHEAIPIPGQPPSRIVTLRVSTQQSIQTLDRHAAEHPENVEPSGPLNFEPVRHLGIMQFGSRGTQRKFEATRAARRVRFDLPSPSLSADEGQQEFDLPLHMRNTPLPELGSSHRPLAQQSIRASGTPRTTQQHSLPFRPLRITHLPEDEEVAALQHGFGAQNHPIPPPERTPVIAQRPWLELLNAGEEPRPNFEDPDTWSQEGIADEWELPALLEQNPCEDHDIWEPNCIHCIVRLLNVPIPALPEVPANPHFDELERAGDAEAPFAKGVDVFALYTQHPEEDSGDWRSLPPRDLPEYMSYRIGPRKDERLMKNQMPPIRWLGDTPPVPEHADFSDPRHWAALSRQDQDLVWQALSPTIQQYHDLTHTNFHRREAPWLILGYHMAHALFQWKFSQWCFANLGEEHEWVGFGEGHFQLFKLERWYGLLGDFEFAPNWPARRYDRDGKMVQNPDCFACNECVKLNVFCHGHREHPLQYCQPCLQNHRNCSKTNGWNWNFEELEFEDLDLKGSKSE